MLPPETRFPTKSWTKAYIIDARKKDGANFQMIGQLYES